MSCINYLWTENFLCLFNICSSCSWSLLLHQVICSKDGVVFLVYNAFIKLLGLFFCILVWPTLRVNSTLGLAIYGNETDTLRWSQFFSFSKNSWCVLIKHKDLEAYSQPDCSTICSFILSWMWSVYDVGWWKETS